MLSLHKLVVLVLTFHFSFCNCNIGEFQANVDGFMNAFDDAYSTEVIAPTTDEIPIGNDIVHDTLAVEEGTLKDYEESGGVQEEAVITETVFQPGSEIKHEINEDLVKLATRVVASISPDLELVNITEAVSMVTDKVERSISLRVARRNCEGDCSIACRVDVISRGDEDIVKWHNCLETNDVPRIKRGAVGGFKQVDEAEAQELAEIAAQTLDTIDADDVKRVVTQVIRAQKQLVNGIMYHLTLEMAMSDCKEEDSKCQGKLSDYNICKILMQRLFSGEAPHNAQVIKSECNAISKSKDIESKKQDQKRAKRHVAVDGTDSNLVINPNHAASKKSSLHGRRMMGGLTRQDPNSDQIKEISEFALTEIDKASNSLNKQKIVRVVDAQSQVVSGVKYFLKMELVETDCRKGSDQEICNPLDEQVLQSCEVVLWDKPWEKFRTVTKIECKPVNSRERRALLGGKKPIDVNDERVKEMAQYAVAQLDAGSNSLNSQKLIEVKEAQIQVVAGSNYYLKLQLVETDCRKGSPVNSDCKALNDKAIQECDVVVYDRPWEKHREMTSSKCNPLPSTNAARNRRGLDGGKKPADVNDEKIKEIAQFALAQLDAGSNSLNSQKLIEIKEAQTQVVAGSNYYLKLQLVETDCRKGSPVNSDCNALAEKPIQECDVVVYDRPWEKKREMTSSKCNPLPSTKAASNRRETLVGGLSPADVNDERVKEMAQFALAQLDARSNSLNAQNVIKIVEAKTQVVAGANYYLKLQLAETNCRKGSEVNKACSTTTNKPIQECDVVVYDRPWDKHREMTSANCKPLTTNVADRRKRDFLAGGLSPADVNDERVKEMAQFALAQLDARTNSLNTQSIIKIVEAKTQVVAGANYYLKLQLVETNCRKGSEVNKACNTPTNKQIQECDVVVYDRPWDKHREMTSANCKPLTTNVADRRKRAFIAGGLSPADVNGERVKEMAQFALAQLDARSNSINTQSIIKIVEAKTQVVAGSNYYLKLQLVETNCRKGSEVNKDCSTPNNKAVQECDVVVYDRPWDKHREMTSANCKPVTANVAARRRREVLDGGRTPEETDSEDVKNMAEFAVEDMNKKSNSMFKKTLIEVISAETQIVAGINYHLKLRVADSNCRKNIANAKNCSPTDITQVCHVTVWSQPWTNHRKVTKSACQDTEDETSIGGLKLVDPLSPEVLDIARLSLKTIDKSSNSMYKHALIRVISSKVQTVAGKKYFLTIEVGESVCSKNNNEENCSVRPDNSMNDRCNVVVWDRPWMGQKEVLSVNCGRRSKQSANTPVDINDPHISMFEEFKRKYNKVYSSDEEHLKRFRIFRANLKKIKALQDTEQGTGVYGPNMFADLSGKEFKRQYLGLKPGPVPKPSKHHMVPAQIPNVELPVEFDWRDHGAVTPVKNQGQCGSCWAFSVTGNVEGQWFLKHGKLLSLSEQELVDCDKKDDGCMGGYMTQAYEAIEELGGLESEDEYPYEAENESCKFNKSDVLATVSSSLNITTNETEIAQWLYKNGPISIGINANAMQFYMGGVSHPFKFLCNKEQLDHGVLLVGFGIHRTSIRHKLLPYWLVKNSWGPHWGEKGYYRVYRGDGTCGVNQMASSAIVG